MFAVFIHNLAQTASHVGVVDFRVFFVCSLGSPPIDAEVVLPSGYLVCVRFFFTVPGIASPSLCCLFRTHAHLVTNR